MDEAERPEREEALNRLLASQGYTIRRQPGEHAGGKWILHYASALGGNGTLELDVNYMARQPRFGAARVSSVALGEMRASDVLVLDLHEVPASWQRSLIAMPRATSSVYYSWVASRRELNWSRSQTCWRTSSAYWRVSPTESIQNGR